MCKTIKFLAILGLYLGIFLFVVPSAHAVENMGTIPAGFYQFNNLEIFKNPSVDEPPAVIEVIQKNEKSCVVYENGKTDLPLSCAFNNNENNNYQIQILVKVWQRALTPEQALKKLVRAGPKLDTTGKREKILDLLLALSEKEINTTEAEKEIENEQK